MALLGMACHSSMVGSVRAQQAGREVEGRPLGAQFQKITGCTTLQVLLVAVSYLGLQAHGIWGTFMWWARMQAYGSVLGACTHIIAWQASAPGAFLFHGVCDMDQARHGMAALCFSGVFSWCAVCADTTFACAGVRFGPEGLGI